MLIVHCVVFTRNPTFAYPLQIVSIKLQDMNIVDICIQVANLTTLTCMLLQCGCCELLLLPVDLRQQPCLLPAVDVLVSKRSQLISVESHFLDSSIHVSNPIHLQWNYNW